MTIINRALTKAYQRRSQAAPGNARDDRPASVNGWAPTLRDPLRPIPIPAPAPKEPEPAAIPLNREETAAPAPPAEEHTAFVRVDLAHVILGQGIAKEPAVVNAPPATELPEVETKEDNATGEAAPLAGIAGAMVRIDAGHRVANPPATEDVRPTDAEPVTAAEGIADDTAQSWSWPPIVTKLLDCSAGAELRKLAASLKHLAATRRLACLALSGPGRATGRTSLVLTLAHILAETQNCRVAIVDADFGHPDAADLLSLRPRRGLWEAACEKGTAGSAAMSLVEGKLSVVPLVEPVAHDAIDRTKIGALQSLLRSLRRENDLVLVDAGPWEDLVPPLVFESRAIDALLCVARHDAGEERLDDDHYRQPGVEWLGTIETFAPPGELTEETVGGLIS